jgi:SAM-dependent methyltransferase
MDRRLHWERVYGEKAPTEVSWFQPRPETSLALVKGLGLTPEARIIDVGGGASTLVDHLLEEGFTAVTVLDLSGRALAHARRRLGNRAARVRWVEADVTAAEFERPFDLWHDRAVFHFLVDPTDRDRYRERVTAAVAPGGHAIVATFDEHGPERCSGLPVVRYGPEALAREMGPGFALQSTHREVHRTPAGRDQSFVYCVFAREALP